MESAGGPSRMMRAASVGLLLTFAGVPLCADACTTIPPLRAPPITELVQTSDMVAIVHVDRIHPLTAEETAFTGRIFSDPPLNVPIRLPTQSADVTVVRSLKGTIPKGAPIGSGTTSCDVVLMEGRDYLIFAQTTAGSGDKIEPRYGTFMIDRQPQSLAALAEVEHSLSSSNPTPP